MRVCVYGASSTELEQKYIDAVYELGKEMAARNMGLVFGGGAQGMMGAAARGVRDGGGSIIGVAPDFFDVDGVLFPDCTEFIYTKTMRERKQILEDSSDAFIITPGGFGTLDEFFEILTSLVSPMRRHLGRKVMREKVPSYICGTILSFASMRSSTQGRK